MAITLDHPFGVHLWPHFSKGFTALTGKSTSDFELVPGVTPMTTLQGTAASLLSYYIVVLGGRQLMKNRAAFKLQTAFILHNFILTAISGVLLALFVEQILPTLFQDGVLVAICDARGGWTDELVLLYYVRPPPPTTRATLTRQLNYLTKYLELADTVFLVLKKKPLTFLHTYHHGATALLCYVELVGRTSVSWVPITLNLTVHVVMYWYYFQSARGIRIWWKRYITILQIAQFVIDIGESIIPVTVLCTPCILGGTVHSHKLRLCRIHLLRVVHVLRIDVLPLGAECRKLHGRGVRGRIRGVHHQLVSAAVYLVLPDDV